VEPVPTPDELADWLRVAGPGTTATGSLTWTPGDGDLNVGWVSFGELPLLVELPPAVEVRFAWDGPRRWALDGPDGPLGRCDGRRGLAWRDGQAETGGLLLPFPDPEELLLPEPPEPPDGEVAADELLGRACWRWTASDGVRWVDELTGCLLARRTPAGTLALTSFTPGAPVDLSLFDVPPSAAPPEPSPVRFEGPVAPAFSVPWWPHGTLSYPVGGDPEVPSLLVQLAPSGEPAPSVWVGVAPLGQRAPVRPGVRSRRWDGEDCALSLSWTRDLSDDDVDRVVASVPRRWL
jgi:hypothetical protein